MNQQPSKSARKREHQALQALGEKLIGLPEEQLRGMPLGEELLDALLAAGQMSSRGALRRQRRLIGKLMARTESGPIVEAYRALTRADRDRKAVFKRAEEWRDRIAREGRPALDAYLDSTGHTDPALLGIVRELARCRTDSQRKTLRRALFREIHGHLQTEMQNSAS